MGSYFGSDISGWGRASALIYHMQCWFAHAPPSSHTPIHPHTHTAMHTAYLTCKAFGTACSAVVSCSNNSKASGYCAPAHHPTRMFAITPCEDSEALSHVYENACMRSCRVCFISKLVTILKPVSLIYIFDVAIDLEGSHHIPNQEAGSASLQATDMMPQHPPAQIHQHGHKACTISCSHQYIFVPWPYLCGPCALCM